MTVKTQIAAALCAAVTAAATLSACTQDSGVSVVATSAAQSSAKTQMISESTTATQLSETESSSSQDSQLSLPETSTSMTSQVISANSVYAQELCASRWLLRDVYYNGEKNNHYYGTVANQLGKYLEFSEDGSFFCVLGQNSCNGTYTIDSGVVSVRVEKVYKPTSKDPEYSGESQTLIWDRDGNTLQFDFAGATNIFIQR